MEKVFDSTMQELRRMQEKMEYVMNNSVRRVDELMDVREKEFPEYDKKLKNLHNRLSQVNKLIYNKVCEDRFIVTKRLCFDSIIK